MENLEQWALASAEKVIALAKTMEESFMIGTYEHYLRIAIMTGLLDARMEQVKECGLVTEENEKLGKQAANLVSRLRDQEERYNSAIEGFNKITKNLEDAIKGRDQVIVQFKLEEGKMDRLEQERDVFEKMCVQRDQIIVSLNAQLEEERMKQKTVYNEGFIDGRQA